MSDPHSLSNSQIADIYTSMLSGDKNGLYRLQKINIRSQVPKIIQEYHNHKAKLATEQHNNSQEQPQSSQYNSNNISKPLVKVNSSLNQYQSVKKAEEVNLNNSKPAVKNLFIQAEKTDNKKPYLQHKPSSNNQVASTQLKDASKIQRIHKRSANSTNQSYLNKQRPQLPQQSKNYAVNRKSQSKVQLKLSNDKNQSRVQLKPLTIAQAVPKQPKIHILPKVSKAQLQPELKQIQSEHLQNLRKKHVQSAQLIHKKKKKKTDFKQIMGLGKKLKNQTEKINEQQNAMQIDFMNYHNSTKNFLNEMKEKHDLNFGNKAKYLKRKSTKVQYNTKSKSPQQSAQLTPTLTPYQLKMQTQKYKCQTIKQDLNHLNILFNDKASALQRATKILDKCIFGKYLIQRGDLIQEDQEQEQEDIVEPLQSDPQSKYVNLMAHTKDRKWGLVQRTQYETNRSSSLTNSRKTGISSRLTQGPTQAKDTSYLQNKVTVNQQLKNLLFG